ncbi:hypothetical protein PoB_002554200 [Plakobranchus ocellatus]|uniref:Uncharacterized protein n=1 Tax=Plakobranchus ocellatus TaxID=259542 RepID=A0AAV3ZWU8_9GAST|nr:hypothetical protein PoB_002554200 [Plakobranchus ocellatus]
MQQFTAKDLEEWAVGSEWADQQLFRLTWRSCRRRGCLTVQTGGVRGQPEYTSNITSLAANFTRSSRRRRQRMKSCNSSYCLTDPTQAKG